MSCTKGEWDWTEKEDMSHGIGITTDGAVFATVEGTDKEAEDTARLIAAAPDFWQASKEFINGWKNFLKGIDFNHSYLNADAIRFMNEVPGKIEQAFIKAEQS